MSDCVSEPFFIFAYNFTCTGCSKPSTFATMARPTTNHKQPRTPSPPICRTLSLGREGTGSPPPPDYHLGHKPSQNGSCHHSGSLPIGSAAYHTFTMLGCGRWRGRGITKPASKPNTRSTARNSSTLPLPSCAPTQSSSHAGQPSRASAGVLIELDSAPGTSGVLYRTGLGVSPLVGPALKYTKNEFSAIPGAPLLLTSDTQCFISAIVGFTVPCLRFCRRSPYGQLPSWGLKLPTGRSTLFSLISPPGMVTTVPDSV